MKNKYVYLDFEYFNTTEKYLTLVCCSLSYDDKTEEFWLLNEETRTEELWWTVDHLHNKGYIFVAYNVQAEARSLLSTVRLENSKYITNIKWIDLYLEWRCLINHNNKLAYGSQLIDGKIRNTKPPKPKWARKEGETFLKPSAGLAACTYKLLGIQIDTDHKTKMRDIIISGDVAKIEANREAIQKYCTSDIKYLPRLLKSVVSQYASLFKPEYRAKELSTLVEEMHLRADYSARTAIMETLGYPINVEATRSFSKSVRSILNDLCREINGLFPEVSPFRYVAKENKFSMTEKNVKDWIRNQNFNYWIPTKGGSLSLSLEAFSKHFSFSHTFPTDNFGAQMVRFLKTKQSLNGFMPKPPKSTKKKFWDSVGSDGRVRPYFNIYGAQSSRSQPGATGFIPLKSAWIRSLIQPPAGKALCSIDYSSQEFLLAALMYKDPAMIDAYSSGDVYLYFAKEAGAVPKNGTKKEYPEIRDMFKGTTLGISYDMTKVGLAKKLTNDLGKFVSEDEAQEKIDMFNNIFHVYAAEKEKVQLQYMRRKYLKLPCGWYMWGDNPNQRSVGNFPVQGFAASIMRKAVQLAQDAGLDVIYTLHDALVIEYDIGNPEDMDTLYECMKEAFIHYFEDKESASMIRLDIDAWSPELSIGEFKTPKNREYKSQQIYIDPRAKDEYEKYKIYLENNDRDLL